jgi:Ferritin-like domain
MNNEQGTRLFGGEAVVHFRSESDRRSFLRNALLVGVGATYVASAAGDPRFLGSSSAAVGAVQAPTNDLDILNYALTLEYLEAGFYELGIAANLLTGRELALVTPIRDHELAHVTAVTDTINGLGGKPVEKPKLTFPKKTFKDRETFLATAAVFEELGVKAYHGQVPLIESVELLGAAASIAGVESRHAAILADLTGGDPFPRPIEATLPMKDVLEAAMPYIKS